MSDSPAAWWRLIRVELYYVCYVILPLNQELCLLFSYHLKKFVLKRHVDIRHTILNIFNCAVHWH